MLSDLDRYSLDRSPRWLPLIVGFGDLLAVGLTLLLIGIAGGLVSYLAVSLIAAILGWPA